MKTQYIPVTLILAVCYQPVNLFAEHHEEVPRIAPQTANSILPMPRDYISNNPDKNAGRKAFFGDLHVHTKYSFDAYAFGTLATPYDAYRYAKGDAIKHPGGFDVKMRAPLDFYAVTDHAMFLGLVEASADTNTDFSKTKPAQPLHNLNAQENLNIASIPQRSTAFRSFLPAVAQGILDGEITVGQVESVGRSAWADTVKAADKHNQPGTFTTFAAYEYTSSTNEMGNLHRNVIFRGTDKLPSIPFSRFHSQNPELLWDWMDDLREQGIESLAIPHNSNGSNGAMFEMVDWAKNPIDDAYADRRLRNEPLVEITQVKGTSETHPSLSVEDEWADFEIMPYRVATSLSSAPPGSYVRDAYLRGLKLAEEGTANPYRFGLVGASDTHTAAISIDESNFFSKVGLLDSNGVLRGSLPIPKAEEGTFRSARNETFTDDKGRVFSTGGPETWGASGLAAVWAEENTREAIYNAFRRKETFATTGPRIKVRLFAGYDYEKKMLEAHDVFEQAYAGGVTMGNDLIPDEERTPAFIAWATRDAASAPLQRLQIIKGWRENGESQEQVYDVACSKGKPNSKTHRCKDNGAKVDIGTCAISGDGAAELKALWKDPDFDPTQRAFYYVRVLENPTCRWSTWDAVHAGVEPRQDLQKTLQERAWSSPIWYTASVN
ncbi:MAG: DUF3604 domain-containing protein [Halieaceae bacterium]|jgi:hypothetical protein|nr:DUF3604 domain-containing protein [Halieaceae bacterium]